MATRAQLQHIRRHLYKLKRRWGSPVDIYFESSDVNDLETGKRVVTAQKWSVSRGVPLPRKVTQSSLLSIALKELFTRGAVTETGDRQVLLDRTDLPSDFQLGTENWYFIIDGIRYQVLSHEDYEGFAYIVALKSTTGAPRYAQVEMKVKTGLNITSNPGVVPLLMVLLGTGQLGTAASRLGQLILGTA